MIKKKFRQMLLTQILSAMTVTICMMIDSIMIGRFLGVDSMAAYGLASPVLLVFAALGAMISAGIQVVCGKTMGSGDEEGTNACYTVSILMALVIAAAALLLVFVVPNQLCMILGAGKPSPDNQVFWLTKDYLTGFIVGAPAFLFAQLMVPYVQVTGQQNRLIAAVLVMTFTDVGLDLVNVFMIKGGMLGMGLASSVSYYVALAIGLTYFLSKKCIFRFRPGKADRKTAVELLRNGIPTVINQVSLVLMVYLFNQILLGVGGNLSVAAYSVISTISNICYSFGSGVAAVALTLSSIFYVDEDRTSLLTLVRIMTNYAVVIDLAVTVLVLLTAPSLVGLFLTKPEAKDLAVLGLRLFSLCLVPCSLNTSFKNFYQGTDRTHLTEMISVLQNFLLPVLYAFLFSRFLGTTGVWMAFVCGETTAFVILSCLVWHRSGKFTVTAEAYAMLRSEIGEAAKDCFEATVFSKEDVENASIAVSEFCKARGEGDRMSYYVALCVEEMANNIVDYGFTKDKKEHSIDIRYMKKNGEHILRIRDDCEHFDPLAYLELYSSEDRAAHIGIRMVMGMVKDARYINSLGLNNLSLIF